MEIRTSSTSAPQTEPLFLQEMLSLFRQGRLGALQKLAKRHGLTASVDMALQSYDQTQGVRRKVRADLLRQLYLWAEEDGDRTAYKWSADVMARRQEFVRPGFWRIMARALQVLPPPLRNAAAIVAVPAILGVFLTIGLISMIFPFMGKWTDRWMDSLTSAC